MNSSNREILIEMATIILLFGYQPATAQKEIPVPESSQPRDTEAQQSPTPYVLVRLKESKYLAYQSLQSGFQGPRYGSWGELLGAHPSREIPLLLSLGNGPQRAFTLVQYPGKEIMLMSARDNACVLADEHRMKLFEQLVAQFQHGRQMTNAEILSIVNGASHCKPIW